MGAHRERSSRPGPRGGRRRARALAAPRTRRRALAATALALSLALATAASAHHGEPATGEDEFGTLGAQNTGGAVSTDTELTPVGKDGATAGWQQIAGSLWRSDGTIADLASPSPGQDSPTPYDLDFYGLGFLKVDVAMTNGLSREAAGIEAQTNGLAVGAQCRRSNSAQPVPPEGVTNCDRIPVIYRYYEHPARGLIWEESYRADDENDPGGFVAAVAWLTPDRALAVGGTGTYPRREVERLPSEPDTPDGDTAYARRDACQDQELQPGEQCQGAGMARAWIFQRDPESEDPKLRLGFWRELQNLPDGAEGDEIPDQMRALQAIEASPRPADCLTTLSGEVPHAECAVAGGMRQLWHFADGHFTKGYGPELNGGAGMTCTAPTGTTCTVAAHFRFRVRDIRFFPVGPPSAYAVAVTSGCCSADRANDRPTQLRLDASGWHASSSGIKADISNQFQIAGDNGSFNPDSYYAVTAHTDGQSFGVLRTPGGPSQRYVPREPPSRFSLGSATGASGNACDNELCAINGTLRPRTGAPAGKVPAQGTTLRAYLIRSQQGLPPVSRRGPSCRRSGPRRAAAGRGGSRPSWTSG